MSLQSLATVLLRGFESMSTLFETVDAFLAVDQHEELHAAEFEFEDRLALVPHPSSDSPVILGDYSRFRDSFNIWYSNENETARALSNTLSVESFSTPLSEHDLASLLKINSSVIGTNGGEALNSFDAWDREPATTATESGCLNPRNPFSGLLNVHRNRDSSSKSSQLARSNSDENKAVDDVIREKNDVADANTVFRSEETEAKGHDMSKEKDHTETSIHDYEINQNDKAGPSIHDYDLDEEDSIREVEAGSSSSDVDRNVEAGPSATEDDSSNIRDDGDEEFGSEGDKATEIECGPLIHDYDLREEEQDADLFTRQSALDKDDGSVQDDERDMNYVADSSGLVASSCAACLLPDSDSMILCDNYLIHIDGESWYHYGCVGLTADTVPEGEWHCPPCREKKKPHRPEQQNKSTKSPLKQKGFVKPVLKKRKEPKEKDTKAKPKIKPRPTDEKQEIFQNLEQGLSKDATNPTKELDDDHDSAQSSVEDRRLFETLKEYMEDETVPKKFRFSELKWKVIRENLLERYGYDKTHSSIKNTYTRRLREKFGFDERSEKKRNPNKMRTSVESPESRKRKRQGKAQGNDQPASRKKAKCRARKEDEDRDEVDGGKFQQAGSSNDGQGNAPINNNVTQQESSSGEVGQNSVRNFEDHLEPHEQLYDWTRFKNKGKRKREEEDESEEGWDRRRKMAREF